MYNQYVYKEPAPAPLEAPAIGPMTLNKNFQTGALKGTSQGMGGLAAPWGNGTTYQQFANSSANTRANLPNGQQFGGYWTSQKDQQSWDPNYISPDEVKYFLQFSRGPGQQFAPIAAKAQHGRVQNFNDSLQKYHVETTPDGVQRYVLDDTSATREALAMRQFMINGVAGQKPAAPAGPSAADMSAIAQQSAADAYQKLMAQQAAAQQEQSNASLIYQQQLQAQRTANAQALASRFGYDLGSLGLPTS